jgi:hypothetical protein
MPNAQQRGYATNLASEFFVLSALYRLGLEANLTLGNKKGVDIVVAAGPGRAFTIEVKAVAGKNDWLVGQLGATPKAHHFVVLVCYENSFADPESPPNVWIFAHETILPLVKSSKNGSTRYISRKQVRESFGANMRAWSILCDAAMT